MKTLDLSGFRFGKLTVIRRSEKRAGDGRSLWECACDCGVTTFVPSNRLKIGMTKSCGCRRAEVMRKNKEPFPAGMYRSGTHNSWRAMFYRCENPKNHAFADYGGRGISICDRWRKFAAFLEDMGVRPSAKHSIDRIDNDGNYEPGNCRWATLKQQASNRRARRLWGVTKYRRTINCARCGTAQVVKSRNALYCSRSCGQLAYLDRKKAASRSA